MPKKKTPPQVSLKPFKTNERNPRLITDVAFEKLCNSIERDPSFMELRPIVRDESN
jgi:hypothetical protein